MTNKTPVNLETLKNRSGQYKPDEFVFKPKNEESKLCLLVPKQEYNISSEDAMLHRMAMGCFRDHQVLWPFDRNKDLKKMNLKFDIKQLLFFLWIIFRSCINSGKIFYEFLTISTNSFSNDPFNDMGACHAYLSTIEFCLWAFYLVWSVWITIKIRTSKPHDSDVFHGENIVIGRNVNRFVDCIETLVSISAFRGIKCLSPAIARRTKESVASVIKLINLRLHGIENSEGKCDFILINFLTGFFSIVAVLVSLFALNLKMEHSKSINSSSSLRTIFDFIVLVNQLSGIVLSNSEVYDAQTDGVVTFGFEQREHGDRLVEFVYFCAWRYWHWSGILFLMKRFDAQILRNVLQLNYVLQFVLLLT